MGVDYTIVGAIICSCFVVALFFWTVVALFSKPNIYCLESEVFVPPENWQMTHEELKTIMHAQGTFSNDSTSFLSKTLDRSATGQSTHWPPAALPSKDGESKIVASMAAPR